MAQTDPSRMPVLIGVGQITDEETPPAAARSPVELMAAAARLAAADAGGAPGLWAALDSVAVMRLFSDSSPRFRSPHGRAENPPWSVARRLGAAPREFIYTPSGGNMPQVMLNRACARIAAGESSCALLVGAEAQRTELAARRAGIALDWAEAAPEVPDELGGFKPSTSAHEVAHGLAAPINIYPLFEQAVRGRRGDDPATHRERMGALLARFAGIAAANPLATRRQGFTEAEIVTPGPANPLIGAPYTKLMCANIYIDQAAAVLVASEQVARDLGVPADRLVYLHGCGEANDHWFVSDRIDLHSSPALRLSARRALEMAGRTIDDMACFDIYSCFASAVEVACQELGLAEDDPRGLTVTGGLPYFGGPGNNYVMHAIAEMAGRLRRAPGTYGFITANGSYLTKHAAGVYSTARPDVPWQREEPGILQREVDALPRARFTQTPAGAGTVESYTVMHDRGRPVQGVVVGRQDADGARFLATTPADEATLRRLVDQDMLGRPGRVHTADGRNVMVID